MDDVAIATQVSDGRVPVRRRLSHQPLRECKTLEEVFNSAEFFDRIEQSLPSQVVKPERILRTFVLAATKVPLLAKCEARSFVGACLTLAQAGLEPNSDLGHAYLIPFKDGALTKRNGRDTYLCQVVFGYKGLLDLIYRSRLTAGIHCDVVYQGDHFSYEYGSNRHLSHRPTYHRDDDTPDRVYAYARLLDGGEEFEVLTWRDIEAIRNKSQAYRAAAAAREDAVSKGWRTMPRTWSEAPWVAFPIPMARKTALRAASKWLPRSVEVAAVMAIDDASDRRRVDLGMVLDAEPLDPRQDADDPSTKRDYLAAAAAAGDGAEPTEEEINADLGAAGAAFTDRREATPPTPRPPPPAPPPQPPQPPPPAAHDPAEADRMARLRGFEAYLIDEFGNVGETAFIGADGAVAFARIVVERWRQLRQQDGDALVAENEPNIEEAREISPEARAILAALDPHSDNRGPDSAVAAVQVPMERGRPSWTGYVHAIRAALAKTPQARLAEWIDAQRPLLPEAPPAQRMAAIGAINQAAVAAAVRLPEWVNTAMTAGRRRSPPTVPAPAEDRPDPDVLWVDQQVAELQQATDPGLPLAEAERRYAELAENEAIKTRMVRLSRDNRAEFQRADLAFVATRDALRERRLAEDFDNVGPPANDPDDPGPEAA